MGHQAAGFGRCTPVCPPPAGRVGVCPGGLLSQLFGLFLLPGGRASGAWYRNGAAGSDFGCAHPPPGIRAGQDVLWGSFAPGNPDSKYLAWARSPAGIPQRRPWAAPGSSQIWVVWGEPEVLSRPSGLLGVPPTGGTAQHWLGPQAPGEPEGPKTRAGGALPVGCAHQGKGSSLEKVVPARSKGCRG